jgi:GntR family transcriptional repressor for pyruvate dehydrogenase complex
MLRDLSESVAAVVDSSRQVAFADPKRVREPIREHERVLDAIASGSQKAARKAMRTHISNAASRVGVALAIPSG